MTLRTILLGTAACALLASPVAAQTTTKTVIVTKHHHHHRVVVRRTVVARGSINARIDELEAQIRELKEQVNHPAPPPPPPQPEVTAAQFQALQSQVDETTAEVKAAPSSGWWDNTKISGRMYYDITDLNNKADGTKTSENGTNFDIKRFYLGVDHEFNNVFSANLTTDFTYDSTTKASQLYIKKAYLQAKIWDDALILRLGSADMPWIPFVEGLYGYRYVENTLIDRTKYGTSADWGVHALGKLADGLLDYQFSAVNGSGYKVIPTGTANRSKGVDVEGRVDLNYDGFTLGVGGYDGKLGKDVEGATTYHTANRFDAIAAYKWNGLRAGFEYFHANDWMSVASTTTDKADGYSGFASYQFVPEWGVFGRYDWVRPKNTFDTAFKDNYYNVGISYSPTKIVDFALVYKHETGDGGFMSTSNGTIGGTTDLPGFKGTYNEIGLWGQFQW
jgi:outer membrane murein-binding lipoprotein Lpp